ncbi:MAG: chromate transporter [Myxococcales bacterium]
MSPESPGWSVASQLCGHLAILSLMAIGGGVVMVAPEVHRFVVDSHGWITAEQFSAAYAIAQASPGPNMLYVTLVGWQVAGWAGALAPTVAIVAPPTLLTLGLMHASSRRTPGRFARAIGKGLAPLSMGLLFATAWILLRGAATDWRALAVTLLAAAVVLRTKINPVWVIAAGAAAGVAGTV